MLDIKPKGQRQPEQLINAHAIGQSMPEGIATGASKPSARSLCSASGDKYKNNKTNSEKRKVSRPHCFAARHQDAPLQAPKLSALGEYEFQSSDGVEKVRVMLAKRFSVQLYSAMYIDGAVRSQGNRLVGFGVHVTWADVL